MYVIATAPGTLTVGPYASGAYMEIPREFYDPLTMARAGAVVLYDISPLVTWASVCPGWPFPIYPE